MKMTKVFISHSSIDKPFVKKLKRDLNLNYIDIWLDEDEMFPGDSLLKKLQIGLKHSSHFLIILSPNSVNSPWVEFELENALKQVEDSTIDKIIPIKYRECEIPECLNGVFFANLSKDIMRYEKGWLEFSGENYENQLNKIVKAIQKSTKPLTKEEKKDITGIIPIQGDNENGKPTLILKVIGYKSKSKFITTYISKKDKKDFSNEQLLKLSPIVLPNFLEKYFKELKFGSKLTLRIRGGNETSADFAKFSLNNNQIAIPLNIREKLRLDNKTNYKISISGKTTIEFQKIDNK